MHRWQATEYKSLLEHLAATWADRELERQLVKATHEGFEVKVQPGCLAGIEIGNSYAGELAVKPFDTSLHRLVAYDIAALCYMHCSLQNEVTNNRTLLENVASLTRLYVQHLMRCFVRLLRLCLLLSLHSIWTGYKVLMLRRSCVQA